MPVSSFLDTNILLYAYDLDAGTKREVARTLLSEAFANPTRFAISVQVLQEFQVNFVRAGHSLHEASTLLADFTVFTVIDNTLALFRSGLEIQARQQVSLWDAMILAAAGQAGAQQLLTEDLNPGQDYGGIKAVNPFDLSA